MHIPAIDSLRHERVGRMTDGDVSMLVQDYVKTDETDERGANEPIEGMARPFPLMMNASTPTVVESFIDNSELLPLSDTLIEYVALLKTSVDKGEWVDELSDIDESEFSKADQILGSSLMATVANDTPITLWRTVFENAERYTSDREGAEIMNNPLQDIEGRERYGFEYLPAQEEVDEWDLTLSSNEQENEEGDTIISESLWLRYSQDAMEEERPIVAFQSGEGGYVAASPNVEFGTGMDTPSTELVEAILSESQEQLSGDGGHLASIDPSKLEGTRTKAYLEDYLR